MEALINKYTEKLVRQGLCEPGRPLLGALDADLIWNRVAPEQAVLEEVVKRLNINAVLFAAPAEPYFSLIQSLAERAGDAIYPEDCETRTFLHDIPVVPDFSAEPIVAALKRRKSVIVSGKGIVTTGTVSPEQTFVVFSSVCFACFVKCFSDVVAPDRKISISAGLRNLLEETVADYKARVEAVSGRPLRVPGPLDTEKKAREAISEAGLRVVEAGMVDSFFGNVSCRLADMIYISQTGSSLDELTGVIDPCPLDGSSCAAVTASSELSAHRRIYETTDRCTILHGHPRFSVILSMYCTDLDCPRRGECHIKCERKRFVKDIPIVPGEVGTGKYGLCHTLPPAIAGRRGAIVYGHGLFTTGAEDFADALATMAAIEIMCADAWLDLFAQRSRL